VNATDSKPQDTSKAAAGNTAVPSNPVHGDHDRVAMLSLKADGTPDQTAGVEIIGNKEFALAATREQFAQQAVSAAEQARVTSVPMMTVDDGKGGTKEVPASEAPQDPSIAGRKEEHEAIVKDAEKAADATVGALFEDTSDKGKGN
jgi:hypothetical protein